jgi:hypothetical protein
MVENIGKSGIREDSINQRKLFYFLKECYIEMDILQEAKDINKNTFFSHVFSATEEGKAEILNVVQYSIFGVIPIVILNKLIQRFIPDADMDKSSLELLVEILIQLIVMFCGIIVIHRIITYFPTYSGFKYENLVLTNVILAFLIIVLSIQTKLGIKVNILVDRLNDLWNGTSSSDHSEKKGNLRTKEPNTRSSHTPSQADFLDDSQIQNGIFPPAPVSTNRTASNETYDTMMRGGGGGGGGGSNSEYGSFMGPMAANSVLGGSFGSSF